MPNIAGKQKPYDKQPDFQDQSSSVVEANKLGQELEYIPLENIEPEFPTEDAMLRSETYQLGGMVRPPTAPSIPAYKKGGKVK